MRIIPPHIENQVNSTTAEEAEWLLAQLINDPGLNAPSGTARRQLQELKLGYLLKLLHRKIRGI